MKDKKDKKFYLDLYESTTVGFSVVIAIIIGCAIGYWVDNKFKTPYHIGFFFFLLVGLIAGFQNMFRGIRKFNSDEDDNKKT